MPLQNRVQPDGEIIAHPARGSFMGNRGVLHDASRQLGRARWRHKAWVTCLLSFKGRHRQIMSTNQYTELFFLDEAVAFAAGHRPCGECRRTEFNRFRDAAGITGRISDFDTLLHAARAVPRAYRQRRHRAEISDLPDGTFILSDGGRADLVRGDALVPYEPMQYGPPRVKPKRGLVTVLTPAPLVEALRNGYLLHCAAMP